ncbi:MAG: pilus assembly protein TadG-related protein [Dehalococcoidia bacterium]|nr:pilus assembly protein TadG-related protein [Dehalococcoidia bacterium]
MAILVGVMMTGLIGFSALAIDVGSLVSDKRDLQNAADAMALAGAQDLPSQTDAGSTARTWATKNDVSEDEIASIAIVQQNLQNTPKQLNPQITVTLHRHHRTTLARVIGIDSVDLEVTAAAIKTSPGGSDRVTPFSVLESAIDDAVPGQLTTLKWDANNILQGNTMPIQIDGSGGAVYEETIKHGSVGTLCSVEALAHGCSPTAAECLDATCDSLTGDKIGPTKKGLEYIYDNTDPACNEFNQVFVPNADGTYRFNPDPEFNCNPFIEGSKSSLRVLIVPVIESLGNGTSPVTIKEFALFFLDGTKSKCTGNDCLIEGRFIRADFTTGAVIGTYDPNGLMHFIRLVK